MMTFIFLFFRRFVGHNCMKFDARKQDEEGENYYIFIDSYPIKIWVNHLN
jgi:hypothetical protein